MYRPTSTPSNHPFSTESVQKPSNASNGLSPMPSDTESDLSESIDPPHSSLNPALSIEHENNTTSSERISNAQGYSSEDALGSDDGDYDMESPLPPHPVRASASESPSSSGSMSVLGKRKASAEQEDYYDDPELYGLRRSV